MRYPTPKSTKNPYYKGTKYHENWFKRKFKVGVKVKASVPGLRIEGQVLDYDGEEMVTVREVDNYGTPTLNVYQFHRDVVRLTVKA